MASNLFHTSTTQMPGVSFYCSQRILVIGEDGVFRLDSSGTFLRAAGNKTHTHCLQRHTHSLKKMLKLDTSFQSEGGQIHQ